MKNQKESQGEDNNFSIGIMPNSRVKKTLGNQEDLNFLMCFDYYRKNLIIEDAYNPGDCIEEKEVFDSNKDSRQEKKNISSDKYLTMSKTKLTKNSVCDNSNKNNNSNKKEFFKIEKKDVEQSMSEFQKGLANIMRDNNEFINFYSKNNEIQENVESLFEFLNNKQFSQEVFSALSLFDLPNFMITMDSTLKMWNELNSDIMNLL